MAERNKLKMCHEWRLSNIEARDHRRRRLAGNQLVPRATPLASRKWAELVPCCTLKVLASKKGIL
jgi:hypothetical protein